MGERGWIRKIDAGRLAAGHGVAVAPRQGRQDHGVRTGGGRCRRWTEDRPGGPDWTGPRLIGASRAVPGDGRSGGRRRRPSGGLGDGGQGRAEMTSSTRPSSGPAVRSPHGTPWAPRIPQGPLPRLQRTGTTGRCGGLHGCPPGLRPQRRGRGERAAAGRPRRGVGALDRLEGHGRAGRAVGGRDRRRPSRTARAGREGRHAALVPAGARRRPERAEDIPADARPDSASRWKAAPAASPTTGATPQR